MPPAHRFDALQVGQSARSVHQLSAERMRKFADDTADANPVHFDASAAKAAGFPSPIVHGLLLGSLLAGLIGSELPGAGAVIQSIRLDFRLPAFAGDQLSFSVRVLQKIDALKTLVLSLEIHRGETLLVTGRAQVGLAP